jgi:hypothetical protein
MGGGIKEKEESGGGGGSKVSGPPTHKAIVKTATSPLGKPVDEIGGGAKSAARRAAALQRFTKQELEEDMLVEYIKDPKEPGERLLCQIMLVNDGEPCTYNLRACNNASEAYSNLFDKMQLEVFEGGSVKTKEATVIRKYVPLQRGTKVQALTKHKHFPQAGDAWFNGEILSMSHSEIWGVVYEVGLVPDPLSKEPPRPTARAGCCRC